MTVADIRSAVDRLSQAAATLQATASAIRSLAYQAQDEALGLSGVPERLAAVGADIAAAASGVIDPPPPPAPPPFRPTSSRPFGDPAPLARTILVAVPGDMPDLGSLPPGVDVLLTMDRWEGDLLLAGTGTLVRARAPLATTVTGRCTVDGVVAWGLKAGRFVLTGTNPTLMRWEVADLPEERANPADPNSATSVACWIGPSTGAVVVRGRVLRFGGRGISVTGNPKAPALRPYIALNEIGDHLPASQNVHEVLQIGQDTPEASLQCLCEWNYIHDVIVPNEDECVSVKSRDNIIQLNTFERVGGLVMNRHGSGNIYLANTFVGARGFGVLGGPAWIHGNRNLDAKPIQIKLTAGDCPAIPWPPASGQYPAATGVRLGDNAGFQVVVGAAYGGRPFAAAQAILGEPCPVPVPVVVRLDASMVGPFS